MKILVAVDGGECAEHGLALVQQDDWRSESSQFVILHVIPEIPSRARASIPPETLTKYYEEEAERVFQPIRDLIASQKEPLKVDFVFKVGRPAAIICGMAEEEGFDLIIAGRQGVNQLTSMIMGSVILEVLAESKLPVLLVQ